MSTRDEKLSYYAIESKADLTNDMLNGTINILQEHGFPHDYVSDYENDMILKDLQKHFLRIINRHMITNKTTRKMQNENTNS